MKFASRLPAALLIAALGLGAASPALADDLINQINDAINLYKKGQYSQAAAELELAAQQIKEKQGDQLKNVFPEPLKGWKGADPSSQAMGAAMFGGGITSSRKYTMGEESDGGEAAYAEVEISIIKDSPVIGSMMMLFSNPAIMGGAGGKTVKINNYRGLLKKESDNLSLQLVVANKILVSLSGRGKATDSDLLAYGKGINLALLEKIASE